MTNVTFKLTEKQRKQLNMQMAQLFSANTIRNGVVLETLLTEAEQIMLIKRVAAILMLRAKYSTYRIAKTLHLSHSTVLRYKTGFLEGAYNNIFEITQKPQFNEASFWRVVEVLMRAGLPPRAGVGRWQDLPAVRGTRSRQGQVRK